MKDIFTRSEPSRLQFLPDPFPDPVSIRFFLKRDDELHPFVSGNKWRKLRYNLAEARRLDFSTLLTYGGAYSNHIHAVAAAGREGGFSTVGIIRGEDHRERDNPTLAFARQQGMHLHFITRQQYRNRTDPDFQADLQNRFGPFYELPEGGTNDLAVRGTAEIIPEIQQQMAQPLDYVCCPVGTGGTLAGLAQSAPDQTKVLGFAALKAFRADFCAGAEIRTDYHFGGYARTTPELLAFIRGFEQRTGVRLEQVYTGKMLYGIYDLGRRGFFRPGATVVAIHTGGLQGRSGVLDE